MKKSLWGFGIVLVAVGLFTLVWIRWEKVALKKSPASTITAARPVAPPLPPVTTVTRKERQHVDSARATALQANPDLATQEKQILDELAAQQTQFDAAMIKADPKVAPIIAKMNKLQKTTSVAATSSGTGQAGAKASGAHPSKTVAAAPAVSKSAFSPTEWKELSATRNAALQANPDLLADTLQLMEKKRAIDAQLDAIVAKSNASLAPTLARIEAQQDRAENAANYSSTSPSVK